MSDTFTRELFAWLNAVAADPEVSPLGFKLAFVIGRHINRTTRECFPTQLTLAKAIGATDRAVQKQTAILRARGHIDVVSGGGRRVSNIYRMASRNPEQPFAVSSEKPRTAVHRSETETPNHGSQNPERRCTKTPNGRSHQLLNITIEEPSKERGASRRSRIPEDWTPSEEDDAWARREGFSDLTAETDKFRDYYLGNGKPMVRWSATWRNWMRNSRRFQRAPNQRGGGSYLDGLAGYAEGDER